MKNFNPDTESHPCMKCKDGGVWREQERVTGNFCWHPEIRKIRGLCYGRYFTLKTIPKWCPLTKER
ncbi:MAG: hypothetical protein ACYDEJ_03415 [Desulfitobacteriaceae bacterium]